MLRCVPYIILVIASIEIGRHVGSDIVPRLYVIGVSLVILGILLSWHFSEVKWHLLIFIPTLILISRANHTLPPQNFEPTRYTEQSITLQAIVGEDPRSGQSSVQVILSHIKLVGEGKGEWFGNIVMSVPKYTSLSYGDKVEVEGTFLDLSTVEDEGYRAYLYYHQIYGRIDWPRVTILAHDKGNKLVAYGLQIQHTINQKMSRLMPQDAAAFMNGVVLGARLTISDEFADSLKATGTNHLIVASGYNISILIALLLKMTRFMSKNVATMLMIIMVACYVLVSGLDPSIIRAAIMAGLGLIGVAFGRQREAIYLLITAGTLMLLINPLWVYDAGFQLSFAATIGIIALQPFLSDTLGFMPAFIREIVSTSLAAQLFVYPILAATFGQISLISLLTNLLVVWVVPVVMFCGIIVILLAFTVEPLAQLCATALYPLIAYIKMVITLTATIPFASITIPGANWAISTIYYALLYYLYQLRKIHEAHSSI